MPFTDINNQHFIFRILPPALHPYARLARLDRPVGIWLLLLPAWWAIILQSGGILNITPRAFFLAGAFGLGAIFMRAAGCVINDLWDRDLDKQIERTRQRPLASGEISRKQALIFLALLLGISFLILLCFNSLTIALGIASIVLVVLYPLMKRITWWPQLFLGLTFNWGVLMGWAAIGESLEPATFVLYAACIFWTLGYDTIYAHQDIEDDIRAGVKSTARLFGDHSKKIICGIYGGFIFLLCLAKLLAFPSPLILFIFAVILFYVTRMLKNWQPHNPQSSLNAFKANILIGWVILIALNF